MSEESSDFVRAQQERAAEEARRAPAQPPAQDPQEDQEAEDRLFEAYMRRFPKPAA